MNLRILLSALVAMSSQSIGCSEQDDPDERTSDEAGIGAEDAATQDAGLTDAGLADAGAGDAGDGDASDGDGGIEPNPEEDSGTACPEALRCVNNRLEACTNGVFTLREECEFVCHEGACQGECVPDDALCDDNLRRVCGSDGLWEDDRVCSDLCREGACSTLASCGGGATCASDDSCCVSHVVPGGTFFRSYDVLYWTDMIYEATVSSFRLDRFEVTVGRFRQWLDAYAAGARPSAGDGRNPANAQDNGWAAEWGEGDELPTSSAVLKEQLAACPSTSWTDEPGSNEAKPINCVTWYEAFAFCIWDQGRLPTEAEWNYAAAGGSEQRVFPWSPPGDEGTVDDTYAVFYPQELSAVGSKASGDGKWGHADLAGNVDEWVLDSFQDPYLISPCSDCADFEDSGLRARRGGNYAAIEDALYVSARSAFLPKNRSSKMGFRCARDE